MTWSADGPGFLARSKIVLTVGSDAAVVKSVNGDAVSGASLLLAERIGERGHGCEEAFAIQAESEAQEISLAGFTAEAIVGKVPELVGD